MNDEAKPELTIANPIHYRLKKLPLQPDVNFPDIGNLHARVRHLEALFNLLGLTFDEIGETKLSPAVKDLFEIDPTRGAL